eukprot:COSAG05_NODE_1342_length_5140_cov_2.897838_7_plen_53_part_00
MRIVEYFPEQCLYRHRYIFNKDQTGRGMSDWVMDGIEETADAIVTTAAFHHI